MSDTPPAEPDPDRIKLITQIELVLTHIQGGIEGRETLVTMRAACLRLESLLEKASW